MNPGETPLLFTDGLVERRASRSQQLRSLLDALSEAPAKVDALCEHVRAKRQPSRSDDDVAVLAVQLLDAEVGSLELEAAATAESVILFAATASGTGSSRNMPELDAIGARRPGGGLERGVEHVVRRAYRPAEASFEVSVVRDDDRVLTKVRGTGQSRSRKSLRRPRRRFDGGVVRREAVIDRQPDAPQLYHDRDSRRKARPETPCR